MERLVSGGVRSKDDELILGEATNLGTIVKLLGSL